MRGLCAGEDEEVSVFAGEDKGGGAICGFCGGGLAGFEVEPAGVGLLGVDGGGEVEGFAGGVEEEVVALFVGEAPGGGFGGLGEAVGGFEGGQDVGKFLLDEGVEGGFVAAGDLVV